MESGSQSCWQLAAVRCCKCKPGPAARAAGTAPLSHREGWREDSTHPRVVCTRYISLDWSSRTAGSRSPPPPCRAAPACWGGGGGWGWSHSCPSGRLYCSFLSCTPARPGGRRDCWWRRGKTSGRGWGPSSWGRGRGRTGSCRCWCEKKESEDRWRCDRARRTPRPCCCSTGRSSSRSAWCRRGRFSPPHTASSPPHYSPLYRGCWWTPPAPGCSSSPSHSRSCEDRRWRRGPELWPGQMKCLYVFLDIWPRLGNSVDLQHDGVRQVTRETGLEHQHQVGEEETEDEENLQNFLVGFGEHGWRMTAAAIHISIMWESGVTDLTLFRVILQWRQSFNVSIFIKSQSFLLCFFLSYYDCCCWNIL